MAGKYHISDSPGDRAAAKRCITDLSIIVVSWNTCDLLAHCLQSVHDTAQGLLFELLVVDNASSDGSVAMVRARFPSVRLIENQENVGFARANNQAIDQSQGRYIMLLNSDARLVSDAAQRIVHFLDTHPLVGIVGVRLISPEGNPQLAYGPLPTLMSEAISLVGMDRGQASHCDTPDRPSLETGWVHGACLTVRRKTLEQTGLLDEQFFMFSEEVDLCRRARTAGWKVVHLPTVEVIHLEAGSTGATAGRYLMLYQAKLRYFAKHQGELASRMLLWAMWLTTWLKLLAYALLQRLGRGREQKMLLWNGIARGLAGLRG